MGSRLMKEVLPPRTQHDPRELWRLVEQEHTRRANSRAIWTVISLLALVAVLLHCAGMWM